MIYICYVYFFSEGRASEVLMVLFKVFSCRIVSSLVPAFQMHFLGSYKNHLCIKEDHLC